METTFWRKNISWCTFDSNFATLTDFEKNPVLFLKKTVFLKKKQLSDLLRNLNFSVAVYGKFATIWWLKNFHYQNRHFCYFWTLTFAKKISFGKK